MNIPIRVGLSEQYGIRGIFADQKIKKGSVIERCPIVLIPKSQESALFKTVLQRYYFEWTAKNHAVVLGYGSLFNHSYTPNARYDHDYRNKVMVFSAIQDIGKDEEVTINYNWDPTNTDSLDEFLLDSDTKFAAFRPLKGS